MRSKDSSKIIADLAEEYGISKYEAFDICYSQFEYASIVISTGDENIRLRRFGVFRRYEKKSNVKKTEREDKE